MPPVKRYGSSRSSCLNALPLLSMAISSSRIAREAQVPTAAPAGSLRNSHSNGWTPADTSSLGNTQPRTRCIQQLKGKVDFAPAAALPGHLDLLGIQACRRELQEVFSGCN